MKVSIIIPIYNTEKYLERCIISILNQRLNDYEIILVDDGSNDNSGKICDAYERKHPEIHVIHKENGGASSARNYGIKAAKGEYLMFVDSDDYINGQVNLNNIIDGLKEDVIQYKWIYYFEKKNKFVYFKNRNTDIRSSFYKKILMDEVKDGTLSISASDKFVRRELLIKNNIFFKEGIIGEDIDWSLQLYMHIKNLKVINDEIYVYRQQRENSVTSKYKDKTIKSLYSIIKYWNEYSYKDDEIKNIYLNYIAYQYIMLLTIINKRNSDYEIKKKIYDLNGLLAYEENFKVKMANKLFSKIGIQCGIIVLKIYLSLRNRGIIKI